MFAQPTTCAARRVLSLRDHAELLTAAGTASPVTSWQRSGGSKRSSSVGTRSTVSRSSMSNTAPDAMPGLHTLDAVAWSEEYQAALLDTYHRAFDRIDAVVEQQGFPVSPPRRRSCESMTTKGVFTRERGRRPPRTICGGAGAALRSLFPWTCARPANRRSLRQRMVAVGKQLQRAVAPACSVGSLIVVRAGATIVAIGTSSNSHPRSSRRGPLCRAAPGLPSLPAPSGRSTPSPPSRGTSTTCATRTRPPPRRLLGRFHRQRHRIPAPSALSLTAARRSERGLMTRLVAIEERQAGDDPASPGGPWRRRPPGALRNNTAPYPGTGRLTNTAGLASPKRRGRGAVASARRSRTRPRRGPGCGRPGPSSARVLARVSEQHLQIALSGAALDGPHHGEEVRVGDVGDDHGHVPRAPGLHHPGRPVRHEIRACATAASTRYASRPARPSPVGSAHETQLPGAPWRGRPRRGS